MKAATQIFDMLLGRVMREEMPDSSNETIKRIHAILVEDREPLREALEDLRRGSSDAPGHLYKAADKALQDYDPS